MRERIRIAFATSELVPYVKTGGLADVSAALPKALARLGHHVTVFVPRYRGIAFPPGEIVGSVHVPVDGLPRSAGFYLASLGPRLHVVFVEHPPFFDRAEPYAEGGRDHPDNPHRFAFFARAVLEFYRSRAERPDVFHAHDWQTGLLPVYLKAFYSEDPALGRAPTLFTIHNLAYQGNFPLDTLTALGLPPNLATGEALEFHGQVSYLKGGIQFSELVNTVSPRYAQEIQTPELGLGLDGVLRGRASDLLGILNGVDYDEWDPRNDRHIVRRYSSDELSGKAACKRELLRLFGLPAEPELPLVGVISRLVYQKGFDVVAGLADALAARRLRLVVLGTGEPGIQAPLAALAERAPDRFAVRFEYHEAIAHKIQAGADLFLMPSRYEPCGLTQLYAQRYGTLPVVRATGGLADTVTPLAPQGEGTGFQFPQDDADGAGLLAALDQALALYADRPAWTALVRRAMGRDFSWERSARGYVAAYERAIERG